MILNVVDLFCGLGGQTAGILDAARDRRVKLNLVAVNHWDTAINTHSLNHPNVRHICEPVENLIPARVVPSRRLHLLAAGCECTFHSNARGGGPCNEQSRSQAWQLVRWATDIHVDEILMENVWEFTDWGPLHPVTHRPIKSRKGEFFNAFIAALRNLGRSVEWRKQCAADFGDPTSRKRFILISRANNKPVVWPKPTHCDPSTINHQPSTKLKPWRTAREIIDWSLKGESVFNRKKPLCANTLARIAAGLRKFGGPHAEPFLVILRGTSRSQVNGSAHSLDEPLPTMTAGGGHATLVEPEFILPPEGYYRGNTAKSLDKPLPTITASRGRAFQLVQGKINPKFQWKIRKGWLCYRSRTNGDAWSCWYKHTPEDKLRGKKLPPFVIGQQSGAVARDVDQPLPTVATAGAIRLVEPFILDHPRKRAKARSVNTPLQTVTAQSNDLTLVEPFILPHGRTKNGKQVRSPQSVNQPLHTLTGESNGIRLVEPFVMHATHHGNDKQRVHSVNKPLPTVTGAHRGELKLVQPFIYSAAHGEDKRKRGRTERRVKSLDQPLPTVTCIKKFALCEPVLVQTDQTGGNGSYTRSVDKPLGTIVTKQNLLLVEPMIAKYYATGVCKPIGKPLDTVTTKDRFMLVEFSSQSAEARSRKSGRRPPSSDLRIIGELDILTRMLQPHELAAAHSLDGFKLTGTKEDQTKQIGNSVPRMLAKAHAKMLLKPNL